MPTPTYTPLANITLGSLASSVTFSSINQSYKDLILVTDATITQANSTDAFGLRFNGDAGSNYTWVRMVGASSTPSSGTGTSTYAFNGVIGDANRRPSIFQIMDYSATDKHKTTLSRSSGSFGNWTMAAVTRWANTAAITSVLLRSDGGYNFAVGSTFALYGIVA
jgi:hypothetical protein